MTIDGDGTVRFSTSEGHLADTAGAVHLQFNANDVLWPGRRMAHVDPKTVAALLENFRAAHFFGLKKK